MIIRRMDASFGKLKNDSLELREGLNVIQAPNEAGKSTWSAFIRSMLYGVDTAQRSTAKKLADKNRFQPWDGGVMAGTMELSARGREITITRAPAPVGKAPFKSFSAHYTGTAQEVDWLTASGCGEELTGVSEAVFTRTAFLRQAGVQVDGDPALEKRIAAMVSSGDERQSYAQADAQLRAWMRERKNNRSGQIPLLEGKIRVAGEKLQRLEALSGTMGEYRQNIQKLEQREESLEQDLEKYRLLDEQAARQRVLDARQRAKNDRDNYENAEKALTRDGRLIVREDLDALREDLAAVGERARMLKEAEAARERAEKDAGETDARLDRSSFRGVDQQRLAALVAEAQTLEAAAKAPPRKKRPWWQIALFILMMLVGAGGAAASLVWMRGTDLQFVAPWLAGSVLLLAAGLVLLLRRPGPSQEEGKRFAEFMQRYGFDTTEEFSRAAGTFSAALQRAQTQRSAAEMAAANEENCRKALEESQRSAAEKARRLIPQVRTAADIPLGIKALDEALIRLQKLWLNMLSSENTYVALRDEMGGDPEDVQFIAPPIRSREDTEAALRRCREQLAAARERLAVTQGEQRAMGDPLLLAGEQMEYREEMAMRQEQYAALEQAAEALKAADAQLQTRFSPLISAAAGRLMARLTGDRYSEIVFSKDFSALVRPEGEPVEHDLLSLSAGTRDQAYLALRLALAELVLDGEDPCPIILDDALTNFDDLRMGYALDALRELAATRQIILFTCHSREAAYLQSIGADDVNIVRGL